MAGAGASLATLARLVVFVLLATFVCGGKDYYKILGVDKSASDREIKKAFHKLSMKYHPDKNPSKSAESKFQEISNAYDILSDEEKRKQYDMYGEEGMKGAGNGGPDPFGGSGGFHRQGGDGRHFTFHQHSSGGAGPEEIPFESFFGGSKQFQFNFGQSSEGGRDRGFFQNIFEGFGDGHQAGSTHQDGTAGVWRNLKGLETLSHSSFKEKVLKVVEPWLVFFVDLTHSEAAAARAEVEEALKELKGLLKIGVVNCQEEQSLCAKHASGKVSASLFPWGIPAKAKPLSYKGRISKTAIISWCLSQLPNHSVKLNPSNFEKRFAQAAESPRAILFTNKPATPTVWRSLSEAFKERVKLFEVQVPDQPADHVLAQKFGVTAAPSVVGVLPSGEEMRFTGKTSLESLHAWLEVLERKGKAAGPLGVSMLSKATQSHLCGSDTPLCVIFAVASAKTSDEAAKVLLEVSQKSLLRRVAGSTSAVSYSMVDLSKQKSFLGAFAGVKPPAKGQVVILAYKPKRKRFAVYDGPFNMENVEQFVSSVLDGSATLRQTKSDVVLS